MHVKSIPGDESTFAHFALKRALARMQAKMIGERRALRKTLTAHATLVRLLARVFAHVAFQIILVRKSVSARNARVRPQSTVTDHVTLEALQRDELLAANVAYVAALLRIRHMFFALMRLQVDFLEERLCAHVALKVSRAQVVRVVTIRVYLQVICVYKKFAAHLTYARLLFVLVVGGALVGYAFRVRFKSHMTSIAIDWQFVLVHHFVVLRQVDVAEGF